MKKAIPPTGFHAVKTLLPLLALAASLPLTVKAQTWDGGGVDNNWTTGANWNPDGAPANDGTASLIFQNSTRTSPVLDTNYSILGLTSQTNNFFNFTASGGSILSIGTGGVTVAASNNSGADLNLAVRLTGNQNWTNNGAANLGFQTSSSLDLNGQTLGLVVNSNANIRLGPTSSQTAAKITGGTGSVMNISRTSGTGEVQIQNQNNSATWTNSTINVNSGVLAINFTTTASNSANALGASSNVVNVASGGQLKLQTNGISLVGPTLNLAGSGISSQGALYIAGGTGYSGVVGNNIAIQSGGATIGYAGTGAGDYARFSGVISGANAVTFSAGTSGVISLENINNSFSGGATITGGQVSAASDASGATTSSIGARTNVWTINSGARLNINGGSKTIGGLSGAGTAANREASSGGGGNATLTVDVANATSQTFSGALVNGSTGAAVLAFQKAGLGTQILSGTNTYTGATTVTAGTLIIDGSLGAASAVSVASGAVIGGDGTIAGNLSLANGALFAFDSTKTLDVSGTFLLNNSFGVASLRTSTGGAIDWSGVSDGAYTLMNTSFVFNAGNISNFGDANAYDLGGGRSACFSQGSLVLNVVPEPTTWALLAGSLTTLMIFRRRRHA